MTPAMNEMHPFARFARAARATFQRPATAPEVDMDIRDLKAPWRGEQSSEYARAAVVGTLAIALKALGRAGGMDEAGAAAQTLWRDRDKDRFLKVA